MEKKKTLILLFMLVFTGVTLLGHTPALAIMVSCTQPEVDAHTCVHTGSFQLQVYVVRAFPPFTDASSQFTIFRYEAGVTQEALDAVKAKTIPKPSAWSYIVFSLWKEPLSSIPTGASLNLNQLPNACGPIAGDHIAWKLNPGVNFTSRNSQFDLFTPLGTKIDQCATKTEFFPTALIIGSSECLPLVVNVPAGEISFPFQHWAHFTCDDSGISVNVEFDECTGTIANVACDRLGAECGNAVPAAPTNAYGYIPPGAPFQISNMGPATGVIVCTGPDSQPVYLRGDKAWWCNIP